MIVLFDGWLDVSPVPKARARVVNGRAYTPARTAAYEQAIGEAYRYERRGGLHPGLLRVTVGFFMPTRRRTDLDNCIKSLADGLNGVAWHDDSQIVEWRASIHHDAKRPGVALLIEEALR